MEGSSSKATRKVEHGKRDPNYEQTKPSRIHFHILPFCLEALTVQRRPRRLRSSCSVTLTMLTRECSGSSSCQKIRPVLAKSIAPTRIWGFFAVAESKAPATALAMSSWPDGAWSIESRPAREVEDQSKQSSSPKISIRPHLARRGCLLRCSTTANDPAHRRITAEAVGIDEKSC